MSRMQHAVQHLIEPAVENPFDKQIFALFAAQTVAVPHKTTMSIDFHQLRFMIDVRPERLGEIIFHPHIVVARKIMDPNALLMQFFQIGE